jgi:hypothetical protein
MELIGAFRQIVCILLPVPEVKLSDGGLLLFVTVIVPVAVADGPPGPDTVTVKLYVPTAVGLPNIKMASGPIYVGFTPSGNPDTVTVLFVPVIS